MIKIMRAILLMLFVVILTGIFQKSFGLLTEEGQKIQISLYEFNSQDNPATSRYPIHQQAELGGISFDLCHAEKFRNFRLNLGRPLFSLREISHNLSMHVTVLIKHFEKFAGIPWLLNIHQACEYYVFALRHIII